MKTLTNHMNWRNSLDIVLGKDESIIRHDAFTTNLILFWLKSNFELTNRRVAGESPNTLFGIIPLGKLEISQPLQNITSVACNTKFHIGRLIIGLFFVLMFLGAQNAATFILLLFGFVFLANSYTSRIAIASNNMSAQSFEISILEKAKVENFVTNINTVLTEI